MRDSLLAGLAFAMKREKDLEVGVGDAHRAPDTMDGEVAARDEAANRAAGDIEHLGDVGDGVEFQGAATPAATGTELKIILATKLWTRASRAHVGLPSSTRPAMNSSIASHGTHRRRPIFTDLSFPVAINS